MSKDYHDYVIKDGKLIGEFDARYKECEILGIRKMYGVHIPRCPQ